MKNRSTGRLGGFTLIELLVVILIIGILTAVALPKYQSAVDKSRYATLMPTAKTIANSQETFYKCKKVTDITIRSSEIKSMGKNAWKGITKDAKVHVPAAKLKAYKRMMKKAGMSPKVLYDAR